MVSVCVNLWFRIYVTSAWQGVSGPLAPVVLPSYVSLPLGFLLLFWSLSDHSCLIQPGLWWCQMACGPFGRIFCSLAYLHSGGAVLHNTLLMCFEFTKSSECNTWVDIFCVQVLPLYSSVCNLTMTSEYTNVSCKCKKMSFPAFNCQLKQCGLQRIMGIMS